MKNDWKRKLAFGVLLLAGLSCTVSLPYEVMTSTMHWVDKAIISGILISAFAQYLGGLVANYHSGKKLLGE